MRLELIEHGLNGYSVHMTIKACPACFELRFWEKVERRGKDECWWWKGATSDFGHGRFSVNDRSRPAHAYSWELAHGQPVPPGKLVRHSCDEPSCVNPQHLLIGTQKDNITDMMSRGRGRWPGAPGAHNRNAKVTAPIVRLIRQQYARGGVTQKELGTKHGLSQAQVSKIVRGDSWSGH